MDKFYYLETNALRSLCGKLPDLKPKCFTSYLSVFEIISGLGEREFAIRKSVITNLYKSAIDIVWKHPMELKVDAFSTLFRITTGIENELVNNLQVFCEIIRDSQDYSDFRQKLLDGELETQFLDIQELDEKASDHFHSVTKEGSAQVQTILKEENDVLEELIGVDSKTFIKELKDNPVFNITFTLQGLLTSIFDALSEPCDEDRALRLLHHYNGRIHTYVEAFSYYSASKMATQNSPKRNDKTDLEHLLYLQNASNIILVSNDKMLRNLLTDIGKDNYLTPEMLLLAQKVV